MLWQLYQNQDPFISIRYFGHEQCYISKHCIILSNEETIQYLDLLKKEMENNIYTCSIQSIS